MRVHVFGLFLARAGQVTVGGHLDGLTFLQLLDVLQQQVPVKGCRLVKVDVLALLGWNVA